MDTDVSNFLSQFSPNELEIFKAGVFKLATQNVIMLATGTIAEIHPLPPQPDIDGAYSVRGNTYTRLDGTVFTPKLKQDLEVVIEWTSFVVGREGQKSYQQVTVRNPLPVV